MGFVINEALRAYSPAQYSQIYVTILVSIVVILTSIDPILEKCVHLQVQYSQVLSQYL